MSNARPPKEDPRASAAEQKTDCEPYLEVQGTSNLILGYVPLLSSSDVYV